MLGQLEAGQMGPTLDEEDRKRLEALAASKFGAAYDSLTPEQKQSLFRSYAGERAQAAALIKAGGPAPMKRGGADGRIVTAPTWSESLAGAVKSGLGHYQMAKANQAESEGRQVAGELASDQAEQRRLEADRRRQEEEDRWNKVLGLF